ncbi:Uncharacterised protein [Mycolicibacterium thermoresistibile]|nr:putative uncharacterized protein [Mycolicibacterium thermoresistibile]SNW20359.1 Uncharacterised protein [Mycolicibacterium thermoresistibile]
MDRKSSRARAENAWRLRVRGRLWREIAEELGYRSPRSAQKAVEDFLARTPPTDAETLRRAMGDGLTMIRQKLLDALDAAEEAGDHQAVATLGRAAADTIEKQAKLAGLHIAIPQQIELNVRSAAAVLERAEQELLAIAQQPQSEIVDAEVVE